MIICFIARPLLSWELLIFVCRFVRFVFLYSVRVMVLPQTHRVPRPAPQCPNGKTWMPFLIIDAMIWFVILTIVFLFLFCCYRIGTQITIFYIYYAQKLMDMMYLLTKMKEWGRRNIVCNTETTMQQHCNWLI